MALACAWLGPGVSAVTHAGAAFQSETRLMMGTAARVDVYGGADPLRRAAIDEAFRAIDEVDRLMSAYRPDSELVRLNSRAAREPVRVSAPTLRVLDAGQRLADRSQGAFDLTLEPAKRVWGLLDHRPRVPSREQLTHVRRLVGREHVHLDAATATVRFARDGVAIDLDGLAKGFATEVAAEALRRRRLSGVIGLGGTQYFVGRPPDAASWRVAVADPDDPARILGMLDVAEGAVSTAGGLHATFEAHGQRVSQVLDPRTLEPAAAALSVTVVSPDATMADALAEPTLVLGPAHGLDLVASYKETAAIVVFRDRTRRLGIATSPSLRDTFHRDRP